jgi:AcrR family transcriptional regulator
VATKSERTRERLVETALSLFREHGYEATTMRLIASTAGVSQGSAYYYFDGKDALVQELYTRIQHEHRERALPLLRQGAPLAENLRAVLHAGLDTMAPYHSFGSTMIHVALTRGSPVSPFSTESTGPRVAATGLLEETLAASTGVPRGALRTRLPHLLWLGYLAATLHWVTDTSRGQQRTRELADGVVPLLVRVLALTRLPVGRRLVADTVALVDRLGPGGHDSVTQKV